MEAYCYFLNDAGFEAIPLLGSQRALDLLPTMKPPDLILVDHKMPHMTGPEFLQALKEKHPTFFHATCISGFSSHEPDSPMAQEFLDLGVSYARKADTQEDFIKIIFSKMRDCRVQKCLVCKGEGSVSGMLCKCNAANSSEKEV
jgi:CheY-like chemotaxis protein